MGDVLAFLRWVLKKSLHHQSTPDIRKRKLVAR
jgi:hypothetical protein